MGASIVATTEEHIEELLASVREEDRAELWAAAYQTPEAVLRSGIAESDHVLTGLIDGKVSCIWGVVSLCWVNRVGAPWMVAGKLLDKKGATFLRHCRAPVLEMFQKYDMLLNYVDARNTRAIRWLKWVGFDVSPTPEPYGMLGLPFHKFTMRG